MTYRRPVDLRTKAGRAVRAARVGIDLMRTAAFWDSFDKKTLDEIERHIRDSAPEMMPLFDDARRCPPEAQNRMLNELSDKFENAMHCAATLNPWFHAEVAQLERDYLQHALGLNAGAMVGQRGAA